MRDPAISLAGCGTRAPAPVSKPRVALAASFTRSWTSAATPDVPIGERDRNEISGSALYSISPNIGVFGSIGHTIATTDANGAGATFAVGVALSAQPAKITK
jgi:hypothetical protein